jgi:hypothetical protein
MKQTKEEVIKKLKEYYKVYPIVHKKRPYGYSVNGIWCAGVSSVAGYAPKDFLKFWSAKMVTEFLEPKLDEIKNMDKVGWKKLLLEAKKQHSVKSDDALEIGTKAHDWVENYIKGKRLPVSDDIKNPVKEFLAFENKYNIQWVAVEKMVASQKHRVGGRLDSLAIIDDKLSIIDFKTSSRISEDNYLQTAGYQLCLEEMGIYPEQRIILRLPKVKGDGFEAVLVPTDYDADKAGFLHRRYSWQWANYINTKFMEDAWYYANGKRVKTKKLKLQKL